MTDILVVAGIGSCGFLVLALVSFKTLCYSAALLSVPLVYFGGLGRQAVPLSLIAVLALGLRLDWRQILAQRGRVPILITLLIVARLGYAMSSLARKEGEHEAVELLGFLLAIFAGTTLWSRKSSDVYSVIRFASYSMLSEAFLVVWFRLDPQTKLQFLHSQLAPLFDGPGAVSDLFTTSQNNVLDPVKSGGLLINANTAGMLLGSTACAAFVVWLRYRRAADFVCTALLASTVFFTGSKSGSVVASVFLLVLLCSLAPAPHEVQLQVLRRRLLVILVPVLVCVALAAGALAQFEGNLGKSLGSRLSIWSFGLSLFSKYPVVGVGYGGWQSSFADYALFNGLSPSFPPHNLFIAAWATTGLVGLLLTIALYLGLYGELTRLLRHRGFVQFAALGAAMASGWILIAAFGENEDVMGDYHSLFLAGLLIGAALAAGIAPQTDSEGKKLKMLTPSEASGSTQSTFDSDDRDVLVNS